MAIPLPDLESELEALLQQLGLELVESAWVGSPRRPILRIKMDVVDSVPGEGGVTVDQCAKVSRAVEPWLDSHPEVPEKYVLEVSSPGVERPLTRRRDWDRFQGRPVRVKGRDLPGGRGNRLEGELLKVEESEGGPQVTLLMDNGEEIRVPLDRIQQAHLVFRWD